MAAGVVLHQFRGSHFNEKARWALDWKGIPHERVTHLPLSHALAIYRLSGKRQMPVLELEGEVIAGSARILETLDERFPERPLRPSDPARRREALEIQSYFDETVGPAVRAAVFSVLFQEPGYLCRIFVRHRSARVQASFRAAFPVIRVAMARASGMGGPASVERAFADSRKALEFVAERINAHGQLVDDSFTVADLSCAALLALLADPDHPDIALPHPIPERVCEFLAQWDDHEATAWVREQYALHRPPPLAC